MKRQIRRGLFETNSSSVHTLTICSKKDFDAWRVGFLYFFYGFTSNFECNKPKFRGFYTKDEAIDFLKYAKPTYYSEPIDFDNEESVAKALHEYGFLKFDEAGEGYDWEDADFTTESGDKVVAFGWAGYSD